MLPILLFVFCFNAYATNLNSDVLRLSKTVINIDKEAFNKLSIDDSKNSLPYDVVRLAIALRTLSEYPEEDLRKAFIFNNFDELQNFHNNKALEQMIDFWHFKNTIEDLLKKPKSITTLREIFHQVPSKVFDLLFTMAHEMADEKKKNCYEYVPDWLESDATLALLANASEKIDFLEEIRDGDTLVGVGNTPQFILEYHRAHGKKELNYFQIALSGSPGALKENYSFWFESLLTQKSLDNYRSYLKQIGLTGHAHTGRIFFMDIIGSGFGLKFLIKEYLKEASIVNGERDNVFMLGINSQTNWQKTARIKGVKSLSLDMNDLARKLDCVPNDDESATRFTPHFPSSHWAAECAPKLPHGKLAEALTTKIHSHGAICIHDRLLTSIDKDGYNAIESAVFSGKTKEAKQAFLAINPNVDDAKAILNKLVINSDTLSFCQWIIAMFKISIKDVEITVFERDFTNKQENLESLFK